MKKLLSVILAVVIMTGTIYAVDFNDIEGHWAKPYINEIKESGIVKGYDGGSFKPDAKVTKSESVLMLYRMISTLGLADTSEEKILTARYEQVMDKNDIAKWEGLREAISYFLEHKIIPEEDLADFMRGSKHVNMTRERLCYYLGRTINEYLKQETGGIIESVFKDTSEINGVFLQYIDLLYKNKVVSGDNRGYFNPKNSITRGEFTKLLVESIKLLKKTDKLESKTIDAFVSTKLDSLNKVVFYDAADKTKSYNEIIDKDVKITVGGKNATYKDLLIDMKVKLTFSNSKLTKVEANDLVYEVVQRSGQVTEIIPDKGFLYYKDGISQKIVFVEIPSGVSVLSGGEASSLSKAKVGEYVFLSYQKEQLVKVEFRNKNERFEGVIKSIDASGKSTVTLLIGENEKTFELAANVAISRDSSKVTLSNLKVDDRVIIETEYGKINKLDAISNTTFVSGKVAKLSKGDNNVLSIQKDDKSIEDFIIPADVKVFIDDKAAGLFDLKIDYAVKIKYDGTTIVSVNATTKAAASAYVGVIVAIHKDLNVVTIETASAKYSINISNSTTVLSSTGGKLGFSSLKEGDNIFAYGILDSSLVKASQVLVLN